MRRYGLLILIVSLFLGFLDFRRDILNKNIEETSEKNFEVSSVVKNIVESENTLQYYIGDSLFVYYKSKQNRNNKDIKIGDKVIVRYISKDMEKLYIKEFNYGRHLKSKGIKKYGNIMGISVIGKNKFYYLIGLIKTKVIEINRFLYKEKSDIINAIVIGDKSGLKRDVKYIFSDSGTSHIMAVSGIHISVIIGFMAVFLGKVNSIRRLILISSILLFYNAIVCGGASILRATLLYVLIVTSSFIDKKADIINMLSIIASVLIIKNKYIIYNISFQLSFLSLASIVIFNKYIKYLIVGKSIISDRTITSGIREIIFTSISANIFTIPIVIYYFKEISLVSVIGNIIAVPIVGMIIILDIISVIIFKVSLNLSVMISSVEDSLIYVMIESLKKVGGFGVHNFEVRNPNIHLMIFYYMIIFFTALYLEYFFVKKNSL